MGHRKSSSGRNSIYSYSRRSTPIGGQPSSPPNRPISHSSPVCQSSKPPRRVLWGNGSSHSNYAASSDKSFHFSLPRDAGNVAWNEKLSHLKKSPISLSFNSDDGSSTSSANSDQRKNNISGSNKKPSARPSNPLRYKTELCRSFEEGGECRYVFLVWHVLLIIL